MAYDVDVFPRMVYHPHLATAGHLGHPIIPPEWLDAQISNKYPRELQYMWSHPPYCIFVLGEGNEPPDLSLCYLKDQYYQQLTTNGGADKLITPCLIPHEYTSLSVGGDKLIDSVGRYLYTIM